MPLDDGFRDRFLRALVAFGVILLVITEVLSALNALRRGPLIFCWMTAPTAAFIYFRSRGGRWALRIPGSAIDPVVVLAILGVVAILACTAVAAAFSPPNSADAMAYHMPRVVYWAEQASVRFFPTPYLNQISLQPLAEYLMLHSYVISGSDRFINFVQWFGSLGSIIGVSAVAALFGAGRRGQAIASLFCATLPAGVLAASGAKNDYFMAMWLVGVVYFAARFARSTQWRDALAMGAALGLALLTKATAYLFAPWLLAAVFLPQLNGLSRCTLTRAAAALVCAFVLNAPHYAPNLNLSGSILGYDSAHGDGFFRYRNETFGWRETVSNMLRNTSEQLGARSENWNRNVFDLVVTTHRWLGIDVNDPATTWRWTVFEPPRNANHEANANSHWHLLILAVAACIALWRTLRFGEPDLFLFSLALFVGFLAFCAFLKWQLYEARLLLPLLVAGAPLAGAALDIASLRFPVIPRVLIQIALCLFLLSTARRPAFENWVRPLKGERSVLRISRRDQYFSDMVQWGNGETYKRVVQSMANLHCSIVGIDSTNLSLEYPLMVLLRESRPGLLFVHTGVHNASARYRPPVDGSPCAVVCLDCAGDRERQALYSSIPGKTVVDKFVIFK